MKDWAVIPAALLYVLFDYVWFNVVIRMASSVWRRVIGRLVQAAVFTGIAAVLLVREAYLGFALWILWQFMWVYDALYYLWAWILSVRGWEDRYTVVRLVYKPYISHAWWTPAAWWNRGKPDADDLGLQVSVALVMGLGALLARLVG